MKRHEAPNNQQVLQVFRGGGGTFVRVFPYPFRLEPTAVMPPDKVPPACVRAPPANILWPITVCAQLLARAIHACNSPPAGPAVAKDVPSLRGARTRAALATSGATEPSALSREQPRASWSRKVSLAVPVHGFRCQQLALHAP